MIRTLKKQSALILSFIIIMMALSVEKADGSFVASVLDLFITCDTDPAEAENYPVTEKEFDVEKDLIALHYDFAPDRDDIHSAAADRTMLQSLFGADWMCDHVLPVSGTYGQNGFMFIGSDADRIMEIVWNDCGGYVDADRNLFDSFRRERAAEYVADTWLNTLLSGGDIWIKEGGQSDFTEEVIRKIKDQASNIDTKSRIHLVQHSQWNEDWTGDNSLEYVKENTDYIRIPNANGVLCTQQAEKNQLFIASAKTHPEFSHIWNTAFSLFDPEHRLDFSDTTELLYIMGWRDEFIDLEDFRVLFLADFPPPM